MSKKRIRKPTITQQIMSLAIEKLKKYVSEKGKILPRRVTGLCAKHQRELTIAIKRARHIALLPFTLE